MPGTRAAIGGDGEIRTHNLLFTRQLPYQLSYIALKMWPGREADARLCELHGPKTVFVLPG